MYAQGKEKVQGAIIGNTINTVHKKGLRNGDTTGLTSALV